MNYNPNTSENLQTIDDLITALNDEERTTFGHIIRSLEIEPEDVLKYASWQEDTYTRNCIIDNGDFQLILLCWEPGQKTPVHDHGGQECWVKVIQGELEEVLYNKDEGSDELFEVRSAVSEVGHVTYMKDYMGFHSLENTSDQRSLTLHLYANPIRSCNVFDEDEKTFVNTEMVYHTKA